jgi:hypothetical protein
MIQSDRTFTQEEVIHLISLGNVVGGVAFLEEPDSDGSRFTLINQHNTWCQLKSAAAVLREQHDVVGSILLANVEYDPGVPNLDAMNYTQLINLWNTCDKSPLKVARYLFPGRPKGYVKVVKGLGAYAINKAVAIQAREDGRINTALKYERICENIFNKLPEWARW